METDRIEEVIDLTLKAIRESIDCSYVERLGGLGCLFNTLLYAYCTIEKLPFDIEHLKAQAEKARGEVSINESVVAKVVELLNDA